MTVDAQGAVTQVSILKGVTVAAVYDERFSNAKGNAVPALDKVMDSGTDALAGETGTDARHRYLLELWNTSVGELRETECGRVITCNFIATLIEFVKSSSAIHGAAVRQRSGVAGRSFAPGR
jgi:hypothetical protein